MRKTRQNHKNPGLIQKLKVSKWVCRSPLASFCNEPTLFAIFGPARGQIFGKKAEKIAKHRWIFAFFGPIRLENPVLKKKTFSILLRRPRALARAWSPGPRPGPLRRRMENLNLRLEKFEKIMKKCGF